MKILHYTLGLPPFRTGGLTKYSFDLMKSEILLGHDVFLLFPGSYTISKRNKIQNKNYCEGISVFELLNPQAVSLLNGIGDASYFMRRANENLFYNFLLKEKFNVIHIHTIMGLPIEFLLAAKKLNIQIIYTTHDYFGLCPQILKNEFLKKKCDINCITCGVAPLSKKNIIIMQSKLYRKIKDKKLIKFLRRKKKKSLSESTVKNSEEIGTYSEVENENQLELRRYYLEIFSLIDLFHFNSEIAKIEFEKYFSCDGIVIPITHSSIKDLRAIKNISKEIEPLKITYLGPQEEYKGFYLLYKVCQSLFNDNVDNWHLSFYGDTRQPEKYNHSNFSFNGRYEYEDLQEIFNQTDLLIIPSIWKETFGFIGLEALSYGVPILFSENVGSACLIEDGITGLTFISESKYLYNQIKSVLNDRDKLVKINKNIIDMDITFDMEQHSQKIISLYKRRVE